MKLKQNRFETVLVSFHCADSFIIVLDSQNCHTASEIVAAEDVFIWYLPRPPINCAFEILLLTYVYVLTYLFIVRRDAPRLGE